MEDKKANRIKKNAERISNSAKKRAALSVRGIVSPLFCALLLIAAAVFLIHISRSYTKQPANAQEQTRLDNSYFFYLRQEESRLAAESEAQANAPKEVGDSVFGRYAILVRCSDGRVICQKNPDERMYPASMTKLMTVLVAIEQLSDPENTTFEVTQDIINYCIEQNASRAGFLAGEHVTALDLLYCTVLPSGADAALALANGIAGSESSFAVLMNQKARELGLNDTHFTNVTGLHDENHYTTLRDLAAIIQYGLHNQTFRDLVSAMRYTVSPTDMHTGGFTVRSTIYNAMQTYETECSYILGGKTGFTPQAGQCLAAYTRCNGDYYIVITADTSPTSYTANHIKDIDSLLEQFVVYAE